MILSLSLYIYIYIYIHTYNNIYIYIYIDTLLARHRCNLIGARGARAPPNRALANNYNNSNGNGNGNNNSNSNIWAAWPGTGATLLWRRSNHGGANRGNGNSVL